jgi:mono/diheme cytochrome c family protein
MEDFDARLSAGTRMHIIVAVLVTAACAAGIHASVRASQETTARTTASGIYSEAQAKRGEAVYARACASCHGPDLLGDGQAPSLVGKDFDMVWTGMSVGDLFERIRVSMPGDAPGTLRPAEVADVLAFMLNKGGFPPGPVELPAQPAALNAIKFPSTKARK